MSFVSLWLLPLIAVMLGCACASPNLLYLKAWEICDRYFGSEHPNTVTVKDYFVDLLRQVVSEGQESVLSENPLVQELLTKIKEEGELEM